MDNWILIQNIPHIINEEWTVILANCNEEERTTLINVYQRPSSLMPNKGTGRATPTRAYQQILGNMFNEQVRVGGTTLAPRNPGNNDQVPTSNINRQLQVHVPTSNLNRQVQVRTSGQMMQTEPPPISSGQVQPLLYWIPSPTNASSLPHTSVPRVSMPAIRPPRVTVTSTINTLINANPRISIWSL